jgi:4-hydroxy-3-methylbut-2-enyl diphosphate reductase
MKVIRAKVLGFCMGVRRAVDLAQSAAASAKKTGGRVFSAGPLIHNPVVLKNLQNQGLEILGETGNEDLNGSVVIIRAHGVAPGTEKELAERGAQIVDATCPKVKASQLKAKTLSESGYRIFLAGEERHGEIIGLQGYIADNNAEQAETQGIVVSSVDEADKEAEKLFASDPLAKTALIAQTTFSGLEFTVIGERIKKYFPNLEIVHTICGATEDRQGSLRDMLADVDAVIVAGGKESANSGRLLDIAKAVHIPAFLVERDEDISALLPEIKRCLAGGSASAARAAIGLCAGASTPDDVINAIEESLKNLMES